MTPADIRTRADRHDNVAAVYRTQGTKAAELVVFHEKTRDELRALACVMEAARIYTAVFGNTEQSDVAAFRLEKALTNVEALKP